MLEISDLRKRYGDLLALDGLSLQVRRGRIVGFLGPNGAGKTTAMRCVFDLARPDSGSVTWDRAPIDAQTRTRFGYMPEERGLYPKMRVGDQLRHFARLSGMDPASAGSSTARWLRQLGLADRADAKLEELSHGNQQRVQLAAALVHDPVLAVLDEPFSGLDPLAVDDLAQMMRAIARDGAAILFSSHQLDLVQTICQDVVIIDRGRVVMSGDVTRLREESRHRVLTVEVDGRPWMPKHLGAGLPAADGGSRVLVETSVRPGTLVELAEQAGTVTSFALEPPNLSDLFREAVRR